MTANGLGFAICAYSRAPPNLGNPVGMKETSPYNLVSPVGIKETAPYNLVSPVGIHHHVNRKPNNRTLTSSHRAHRPVRHLKRFKNKTYKLNISTGYSPIPHTHIAAIILKERNTA